MTIKQFVHNVRQQFNATLASSLKTTHIYELIAAAFGYNSYAALQADAILLHQTPWPCLLQSAQLTQRARELGLVEPQAISPLLVQCLLSAGVVCIRVEMLGFSDEINLMNHIVWEHDWQDDEGDSWDDDWPKHDERKPLSIATQTAQALSQLLDGPLDTSIVQQALQQLEAFAERGHPEIHWKLAQLYWDDWNDEEYLEKTDIGTGYWYQKQQEGMELKGPELEFANEFATILHKQAQWRHHALKAAQGGNIEASYALAEHNLDNSIFDANPALVSNPAAIGQLANELDNEAAAHYWYTQAALRGNINAMRVLIEQYDKPNLYQSWVWLLLAQLLGTDLTQDDFRAINEYGEAYDDDIGGPMFIDGSEGITLAPLAPQLAIEAEQEAQHLFALCNQ